MILVWMSVAGSIPLIIYLVIWAICRNSFNYTLGKSLLTISIIFYLLPVQLLSGLLPDRFEIFETTKSSRLYFNDSSNYIAIKDGVMWMPQLLLWILDVWFIVTVIFTVYQTIKYKKSINYLVKNSEEKFYEIEGIGTVPIFINDNITTAYTIGLFRSYIVFPKDLIESEYRKGIYKHEYCHAKNHDALVKLICLVIICIHWFNPVCILLLFAYSTLCEYISDDYATEGYTMEQRKQYASLLIELQPTKAIPIVWRNNFLSTKYLLGRRLTYIMKKKNFKFGKATAVFISAVAIAASSMTVFAYDPMQSSTEDLVVGTSEKDFMEFTSDNEEFYEPNLDIDFCTYEYVFVSDTGEVIYLESNAPQAICIHNFETGYVYKHVSDGKGGCTVYKYSAQRCTKCNYIKTLELVATYIYKTCTHN